MAAAQEERFTRIKHDFHFPSHAMDYCLREIGLRPEQIDYIVFYDKPLVKFDRLLETYLALRAARREVVPFLDASLAQDQAASAARNPKIDGRRL